MAETMKMRLMWANSMARMANRGDDHSIRRAQQPPKCIEQGWLSVLIAASFSLVAAGCGNNLPQTVPVRGQITFAGGPCPKQGVINFSPIEPAPGMPRRPGSGHFGTDGKFVATSFSRGEGLVPGRYSVRIDCWKRPPQGDGKPPLSYVAAAYIPPELKVSGSSGTIEFNLDVPAAR